MTQERMSVGLTVRIPSAFHCMVTRETSRDVSNEATDGIWRKVWIDSWEQGGRIVMQEISGSSDVSVGEGG